MVFTVRYGIYQVNPSWGVFAFGSPLFENVKIELPGKKNFTIETIHNSDENIYIQSVELNGKLILNLTFSTKI